VQLNIQISQGSVATDMRWGGSVASASSTVYHWVQKWNNCWNFESCFVLSETVYRGSCLGFCGQNPASATQEVQTGKNLF